MYDPDKLVIVEDEDHALFDPRIKLPINNKTVLTMMAVGVKVPVLIRKNGEAKDGTPIIEVVDGRQRVKCAREANRRFREAGRESDVIRVPCLQQRGDDKTSFSTMIIANEHRTKDDPMTRARKIEHYMAKGFGESDASVLFNTSEMTIRNSLKLLECSTTVQEAVEAKRIPVTLAIKLSVMPRNEQDEELAKLIATGAIAKPAAAHKAVDKAKGDRGKVRATGLRVRSRKELERAMGLFLGDAAGVAAACAETGSQEALLAVLRWVLHDREALRHPAVAMLMVPDPEKPAKKVKEKKAKAPKEKKTKKAAKVKGGKKGKAAA